MPEYLAPGVFVEEVPASLRAIEGVSTSTAALVGPTARGAVAGGDLPFLPSDGFTLAADPAPTLVTSMGEFVREFGQPLRLPADTDSEDRGYLGHSVKAFFDNGGRRAYICRVADATATRNTLRLGQGVVLRLAKRVNAGATSVALNSLRGIDVGTGLVFRRRSDGTDALLTPATAATLTGAVNGPWSLVVGDALSVNVSGTIVPMTAVAAAAIDIESAAPSPTFNIAANQTLTVRVGPATAPVQTATFDAATITPGAATPQEVALVLARDLKGVSVSVDGSDQVHLVTDLVGTGARLQVTGGSANGVLAFPTAVQNGSGNVADLEHVTFAEIASLFAGANAGVFTLATTSTGALFIVTDATGSLVTLTVSGSAAGALGLSLLPSSGSGGGVAPAITVTSYDTPTGEVVLSSALAVGLDKNEIYVEIVGAAIDPDGPIFHARSVGSWSSSVQVTVSPADRAPVPIVTAAGALATTVQVQSATSFYVGAVVEIDHDGLSRTTHEVMAIAGTTLTLDPALGVAVLTVPGAKSYARVLEVDISVADASGAAPTELYRGLSWNPRPTADILRRHYATQLNARSRLVYVQPPGTGIPPISGSEGADGASQPTTATGWATSLSDTADDGIPAKGAAGDAVIVGADLGPGRRTGIEALSDVSDVRIVVAPGQTSDTVQLALIAHCERMRYRFAVLDGERDPAAGSINAVLAHRDLYDTSYAALYSPWVGQVIDGEARFLPPSGFAAGVYARVDNQRGVWKAPANEVVQNVRDLRLRYTTGEQEILNPRGVNLIRRFEGGGIRVWGARTLSSNPEVKYVNVRRTLIFIEASIDRGTQWVVFEPNTPATWSRVVNSIRAFLLTQWRDGALFGRTEADAFFVVCDESTMTADDVLNGRLICRIGVAIVRPAEFVIFRIEQLTGFAE